MNSSVSPFEKRLKRRVIGRTHEFFVVTAPGLERLCRSELIPLEPEIDQVQIEEGGVGFHGRLYACYWANLHLRTASRILMRVDTFPATNIRQLTKRLADIPWELYLPMGAVPKLVVSTRRSRLYHTGAVGDCFSGAIADRWRSHAEGSTTVAPGGAPPAVFVRADNDRFTVSVDSSGDLLYKRGVKDHGGAAPIRETLAAAILMLAGYHGNEPLIDPLCGSGTFSLEAAMMAGRIPAGWYRSFAFLAWPAFRSSQWQHIRQQAEGQIKPDGAPIFSFDKQPQACRMLQKTVENSPLSGRIAVSQADFFDLTPPKIMEGAGLEKGSGLVVVNPPYGRRLLSEVESRRLTREIIQKLCLDFNTWRFAVIAPPGHLKFRLPPKTDLFPLHHGGLPLTLVVGRGG
jgi:putative N6-adenine-specific DNA methylase